MIAAITVTLGWWGIPVIITLIWIITLFFGHNASYGEYDFGFGAMFWFLGRCLMFIPVLASWLIYFIIN